MDDSLTQREFEQLSRLIYEKSGISLHAGKVELVRARLGKRLRETGIGSFRAYYDYVVQDATGHELVLLLDSISTNLTSFFREPAHFEFVRTELVPRLAARRGQRSRKVQVWSAGCASGEEPYSLAMCLLEGLPGGASWEVNVLATDISTRALEAGRRGIYKADKLAHLPHELKSRFFQRGVGEWAGHFRVKEQVRRLVTFERANLVEGPPSQAGPFEVVFCRNVMIYFDQPIRERVIGTIQSCLMPGGCLFIGHSESLAGVRHAMRYLRPAVYCKPEGGGARLHA